MTTEAGLNVEFSDRYGGHQPSWLRACHGNCEAMGVTPVYQVICPDGSALDPNNDTPANLVRLWNDAHAQPHEEPCFGWHFVICPECKGTARVSWGVTLTRVPRWLWKGVRFIPWAMARERWWEGASFSLRLRKALWACWGADLAALRR